MMNHLTLPLARARDPATSHRAAERAGEFRTSHEDRAQATGMEPVAVARRLKGLEEKELARRYKRGEDYIERNGMAVWWKV